MMSSSRVVNMKSENLKLFQKSNDIHKNVVFIKWKKQIYLLFEFLFIWLLYSMYGNDFMCEKIRKNKWIQMFKWL